MSRLFYAALLTLTLACAAAAQTPRRVSPTAQPRPPAKQQKLPVPKPAARSGVSRAAGGYQPTMAKYEVNDRAVKRAAQLIAARQYVLDSDWGRAQPRADDENAFLEKHSWDDYAGWHLGLTAGATDETKARYAFVYGDLRRVHRSALIACVYRASEWRHKGIELAAHDLLQELDAAAGIA